MTSKPPHPQPVQKSAALDPQRWVADHGAVLYRYALARLRQEDLAENIVQ